MSAAGDNQSASVNPFAQHTVQETHDDLVDVESLYEGSRQALRRADRRVRLGRSHLSVILGDVGSGKSHLLWWLRRRVIGEGVYVPVGALPDLGQPFRYTLRQLLTTLCRKDLPSDASKGAEPAGLERPIDRLLWDVLLRQACDLLDAARLGTYQAPAALLKLVGPLCQDMGKPRKLADFANAATPVWGQVEPGLRAYLLSLPTENSIDSAARAVLLQFPHADRRALVTAWLAGEDLSAKDRERIGAKQSINNEAAARYVLAAMCRLLASHLPGPLVLAYDHMDATAEQHAQPGLQGQAEVIAALQSQAGAVLQVVSCRPTTWALLHEKPARPSPNQAQAAAATQLKQVDDVLKLERPELSSLRELIQARLGALPPAQRGSLKLGDKDLDPALWPAEVGTPRAALQYYAQRIQPAKSAGATPEAAKSSAPEAPVAKAAPKPEAKASAPQKPAPKPAPPAASAVTPVVKVIIKPPSEDATLAVPAALLAELAKGAVPDGSSGANIKTPPEVQAFLNAKSVPATAKVPAQASAGKPVVSAKDAPSKPGVAAVRKDAAATSGDKLPAIKADAAGKPATQTARDADSKPGSISGSKPLAAPVKGSGPVAIPAKAASPQISLSPNAQAQIKDPSLSAGLLTATPPSAQSPSVTWMAMADDDNPLAKAIAEAEAELKPASAPPAKPAPAKPAAPPAATAAKPRPAPVVTVNPAVLKKSEGAKPITAAPGRSGGGDGDGDMTLMTSMPSAPSGQSPSATWVAMAGGNDLLAAAIADAEADLGIAKPKPTPAAPSKPAPKTAAPPAKAASAGAGSKPPASSVSPSEAWMSMGSSDGLISPVGGREAGGTPRGRNTKEKLPPVPAQPQTGLSPEQVMAAIGNRSTVEEALLAQELRTSVAALAAPLSRLEDRGAVRVSTVAGGKRVVSKL